MRECPRVWASALVLVLCPRLRLTTHTIAFEEAAYAACFAEPASTLHVRHKSLAGWGCRLGHDALDVLGPEELGCRECARHDAHEVVHRRLVSVQRSEKLLHLERRGLDLRELAGELVERLRLLVPPRW